MTGKQRALIVLGCASLAVGGCAAVIVPVVAGGVIGNGSLRRHHDASATRPRRPAVARTGTRPLPGTPTQVASPLPVPADPSTMTVGQLYRGGLPAPTGSPAVPAIAPSPSPPTPPPPQTMAAAARLPTEPAARSGVTGWSDVLRFVAEASLHKPVDSVLLAKGSTTALPHWLSCGDKRLAVLVDLPAAGTTMLAGAAAEDLAAIQTMGIDLLFASDQPASVVDRQLSRLASGGVAVPAPGDRFATDGVNGPVAMRATVGARYCVIAIVGSRATDFPNATLPMASGASSGWFLIR